jgi:hypothetical protein
LVGHTLPGAMKILFSVAKRDLNVINAHSGSGRLKKVSARDICDRYDLMLLLNQISRNSGETPLSKANCLKASGNRGGFLTRTENAQKFHHFLKPTENSLTLNDRTHQADR